MLNSWLLAGKMIYTEDVLIGLFQEMEKEGYSYKEEYNVCGKELSLRGIDVVDHKVKLCCMYFEKDDSLIEIKVFIEDEGQYISVNEVSCVGKSDEIYELEINDEIPEKGLFGEELLSYDLITKDMLYKRVYNKAIKLMKCRGTGLSYFNYNNEIPEEIMLSLTNDSKNAILDELYNVGGRLLGVWKDRLNTIICNFLCSRLVLLIRINRSDEVVELLKYKESFSSAMNIVNDLNKVDETSIRGFDIDDFRKKGLYVT